MSDLQLARGFALNAILWSVAAAVWASGQRHGWAAYPFSIAAIALYVRFIATTRPAARSISRPAPGEVVHVACCPEHGLHGCRERCFECGGIVEQVPMVLARDAESWERA